MREESTISIHALREEGDHCVICRYAGRPDFYPRPPRGGRHDVRQLDAVDFEFLSTPSARRATDAGADETGEPAISIHALREEGDSFGGKGIHPTTGISIHALREEGDYEYLGAANITVQFLSTPSARRATSIPSTFTYPSAHFYPRPPRGGRHGIVHRLIVEVIFLSTPSARRATKVHLPNQNQHFISIHALREEGDAPSSGTSVR